MASTSKSAVSDYEHLKYRFGDENRLEINESEDEDFLPLKAKNNQMRAETDSLSHQNYNQNNHLPHYKKSLNSGIADFHSIDRVPVPSAWSPGMIIKPNPSLSITPEKPNKIKSTEYCTEKDNILEPRDLNQIPIPVAWSPHTLSQPSVIITPEKPAGTLSNLKNAFAPKSTLQADTTKSVRFDLPSISSGDEFMDSSALSDSFSPITIQGKELNGSPSPSKAYNPMIYSDDSTLDDSVLEINKSDMVSLSTSANLVNKLNELLVTSKGEVDQKSVMNLQKSSKPHLNNSSSTTEVSTVPKGSFSQQLSTKKKIVDSSVKVKKPSVVDSKPNKKQFLNSKETRSGPHHLSSTLSPYYPPSSGACIVREAKHPLVSTEYSYPFNSAEDQEYEHIFSRPEFNSTLKVRSELDNLCDQDVDMQKAVEHKLSCTKKTEIQEKAAVYTNQSSDQFANLVDLEPSIHRLCDRVVRMRTSKVVTLNKGKSQQKKSSSEKAPDLMEFYSGDLQKESPDFSLPGINPPAPDLMSAPHNQAFECYRHNRAWNGLQDF